MAVTVTENAGLSGTYTKVFDIEATADGDTTATIPHGFGVIPADISIIPMQASARISNWIANVINSTNVVMLKTTTASSGSAGNQVRIVIKLPHSIVA